jgi:DNA-binding NarL/FixJ family response regulator
VIIAGQRRLKVQLVPGAEEDLLMLSEQDETVPAASRLERLLPLTHREAEVLARLAAGRTNDGIAYDLGISRHTVVRHVERIYLKLGAHTRASATRVALEALHSER